MLRLIVIAIGIVVTAGVLSYTIHLFVTLRRERYDGRRERFLTDN